jgi:hypothetical protein
MSPFASDKNNWEAELIQVSIIYTKNLSIDTSLAITWQSWPHESFGGDGLNSWVQEQRIALDL